MLGLCNVVYGSVGTSSPSTLSLVTMMTILANGIVSDSNPFELTTRIGMNLCLDAPG